MAHATPFSRNMEAASKWQQPEEVIVKSAKYARQQGDFVVVVIVIV